MRELHLKPRLQIWVCINERSHEELPSCVKQRGEEVIAALQQELTQRPVSQRSGVWINRSLCQGSCHPGGVSLVVEPGGRRFQAVNVTDAKKVWDEIL